jgi:hypothetical protein
MNENCEWVKKYLSDLNHEIYSSFIKNSKEIEDLFSKTLYSDSYSNEDSNILLGLRFPHDLDLHQPLIWGDKNNGEKIIEVLETLGGNNIFKLNGECEGYIYGISRESSKEILTFNKNILNIRDSMIMDIKEFFML